jgi:hypothetical protein
MLSVMTIAYKGEELASTDNDPHLAAAGPDIEKLCECLPTVLSASYVWKCFS